MKCPLCEKETSGKVVTYTTQIATAQGEYIRRRRKCPKCGGRWWTYEVDEPAWRMLEAFRAQTAAAAIALAAQAPEPEPAKPKYKF